MSDEYLPELQKNHLWFFDKESFKVFGGSIDFQMFSITKSWRHVNSEGWEKYHNEIRLNCILQYANTDELFLSVSELYKKLASKSSWEGKHLTTLLSEYNPHYTYEEFEDIMDDCY